ncbi:MAG: hypothetical protein P8P49_04565 [Opitutales bacterium]|nr:hypothetical protein [Opitutales bacterium]MDG1325020.1 hypothetical protein [Opitutales bacterium]
MGNSNIKNSFLSIFCWGLLILFFHSSVLAQEESPPSNLADAFQVTPGTPPVIDEVEPIVVGRKKWNDKPSPDSSNIKSSPNRQKQSTPSAQIEELDPLETQQGKVDSTLMPIKPPTIPPAVNLHRNFEGTLVLKPRKLGFQKDFPFQLLNSRGKRLAYIDTKDIRSVDPIQFKDKKVNILGKLEPIKFGSNDLVIRARILREIE